MSSPDVAPSGGTGGTQGIPLGPNSRLGAIGVVISAVALGAVIWWATKQESPTFPSSANEIIALVGAIALYAVTTVLRGERWWWLLNDSRANTPRADAYALNTIGYMGNNVLPARGGDALRVFLLVPRATASARTIIGTLFAERLLDVAFLLTLFAFLGYAIFQDAEKPTAGSLGLALTIGLFLLAVAAWVLWLNRHKPRIKRALQFAVPLIEPTRRIRGKHAGWMLCQTAMIWLLEAVTYLAVSRSVGLDMSLLEAAYLIAVSSVFLLIPSGPGYVGTLDAAILFGLGAIGTGGSEAISYLLMLRFVIIIPITLSGLLILVLRYRGDAGLRAWSRAGP